MDELSNRREFSYAIQKAQDYQPLLKVLLAAYDQSSQGKGIERHGNGLPFVEQPIISITKMVGEGYPLGQAMKKLSEAPTLYRLKGKEAAKNEILGAIVYAAAAVIYYEDFKK